MKKSIFLFFAAILCAMSVSAKTIYLHTGGGGLWNQGGAQFGCHTWGKTEKSGFMTHVEGDIYSFETDDANTDVIFTRVQSSATGIWDKEWNRIQTKIPADKDLCTITGWGGSDCKWSDYAPLASHTFTKNSTLYIDFRAITSNKKGADIPQAGIAATTYNANAGGTVIPVTFTADVKWAEGTEFMKTEQGGWASIPFHAPTSGENCAQVAADGKSYTWTTYSEPSVTLSLDKESADAGTEVTVTLTATADNVAGEVTYAFQYSTDNATWNNISSTGNTATQTFAAETRYYKVTMTNGGNTKEATAKFSAIKFHVIGSWDNWKTHNETVEGDVTLALEANKTYEYKITNGTWDIDWGNDGTMTRDNCTDWSFESNNNAKITTDEAGNYVFNVSRNDEGKVKVSVTYPVLTYTVNATAENGTVTGAGEYEEGATATLTATANEGYEFVNWTVAGKEVSTEATYSFAVTADVALVANFELIPPTKYTVTLSDNTGGFEPLTSGVGEYEEGEEVTVSAVDSEGWVFVGWANEEGEIVSNDNPYTFEILNDVTLTATYAMAMGVEFDNMELDTESWIVTAGPDAVYGIELTLGIDTENDHPKGYGLVASSSISLAGDELELVTGYFTEVNLDTPSAPSAEAVVIALYEDMLMAFVCSMSAAAAPVEPVVVVVENATLDDKVESEGFMYMSGEWTDSEEVVYPVKAEIPGFDVTIADSVYNHVTVTVGGWGDEDPWLGAVQGKATVTIADNVLTLTGVMSGWDGTTLDVTISGTLPIVEEPETPDPENPDPENPDTPTSVDNLNTTIAPVKMIENGQLIIVKDGVQYNAQGAILK